MTNPFLADVERLPMPSRRRRPAGASLTRLSLVGEITLESAIPLFKAIRDARSKTIVLEIDSPGGNALCAAGLYELLILHPRRVVADVVGQASSAAGLVAMGADRRRIAPSGTFMLHKTTGGTTQGRRLFDEISVGIFAAATGLPRALIDAWEIVGRTFGADDALSAGLAHEVRPGRNERSLPHGAR